MKKILVVDDDQATRHLLRKVLTSAGFTASVAKDGVEALSALRAQRFDLLLLDVWMPRMNGLELLAKLRPAKARPRIVVMTSDEAPETLLKAVRAQAFKYVHKPVDTVTLLQTVRDVLTAPEPPPVEVISARPEWVELVVPCTRDAAEHIHTVMAQLDADARAGAARVDRLRVSGTVVERRRVGRPAGSEAQGADRVPAHGPNAAVPDCGSRPWLQDRSASARGDRTDVR